MLRPSKAGYFLTRFRVLGFQVAQLVTNSPAMRETGVRSLSGEEPLEKAKAPTPVFWPGEPHGLHRPWGQRVGRAGATFTLTTADHYQLHPR